jgi:8-oxo-dGTP pyrophosphatase MutT (NUDIX family)
MSRNNNNRILGGNNEKDETDVDTVVRETVEEIGLDLNSKDFIPVGRLDDREITSAQDGKLLMMLSPFGEFHATKSLHAVTVINHPACSVSSSISTDTKHKASNI